MLRLVLSVVVLICCYCCGAQDTLVFNNQPNWQKGIDIADHCLFYEDPPNEQLSFEAVKERVFIPYSPSLRMQKATTRPLVIQWFRFTIRNASATDTLHLELALSAHYFTRLYNQTVLLSKSGAYETNATRPNFALEPILQPPGTTTTYYARTEDRQTQLVPPYIGLDTPYTMMNNIALGLQRDRFLFLLLAITVGCLFFISLYAMYQFYLYRDAALAWYVLYTISSLFIGLFWMDIRHALGIFPALVHDLMLAIFVFLAPALYTCFIGSMLQLPVHFKWGWRLVKGLLFIAVLQMIIEFVTIRTGRFFLNPEWYGYFLSIAPIALLHVVLLVLVAMSKNPVKWFLFGGVVSLLFLWCLPIAGGGYIIEFKETPLFMILIFPISFLMIGLTVEAICFAFALSYRAKLVLVEKNNLQAGYALQLETALQQRTQELEGKNALVEAQKIKQVAAEFEQKIAEIEMTALRAQMNPHFIFNCLNSIKLYTLENDSVTASEFLTKFSQLIRLVLENSRSEKVTLQKEIDTLRLYIELEAMRFKNKLAFDIAIEPGLDLQYLEIPPLLLQPYVENAIWHGLMHKKSGGHIQINVSQPSASILNVEIMDDGIGRAMAAAYKSKSATRQKSFGLQMTADRIQVINQLFNMQAQVTITDLTNQAGEPSGTKVSIKIPV